MTSIPSSSPTEEIAAVSCGSDDVYSDDAYSDDVHSGDVYSDDIYILITCIPSSSPTEDIAAVSCEFKSEDHGFDPLAVQDEWQGFFYPSVSPLLCRLVSVQVVCTTPTQICAHVKDTIASSCKRVMIIIIIMNSSYTAQISLSMNSMRMTLSIHKLTLTNRK